MADLMEIIAELSNERLLATRPRQEEAIVGKPFQRAKEAQPLYELADERIHRDQAFGFQFAERHMDSPLIWASGTDAVGCKIGALTDAHAGVADQEEDIRAQIVAFEELPLQQLILFRAQWTGQSVLKARDVLASDQMSKFGKLVHPRQLMERPA